MKLRVYIAAGRVIALPIAPMEVLHHSGLDSGRSAGAAGLSELSYAHEQRSLVELQSETESEFGEWLLAELPSETESETELEAGFPS